MRILARKLLTIPADELHQHITGEFTLLMDDGEIATNAKETIISRYFWDIHNKYPELPLKIKHHIHYHLNGKKLKNKTHTKVISAIADDWYSQYEHLSLMDERAFTDLKLDMLKFQYKATNNYYNGLIKLARTHTVSLDITDIVNIINNPKIKKIRAEGDYSQSGVKQIHKDILEEILNDEELSKNNIAHLLRAGLIKDSQLCQCIGPYGYPKDIDNYIFHYPIKRGFAEGFLDFYDSLTESRSASTSLHYAKSHLSNVEYFSRKAQLNGMNATTIHPGDCGSTQYIPWEIRNEKDLEILEGIYYLDETPSKNIADVAKPPQLKYIVGDEMHLIDRVINIRYVAGCMHPDPNGFCSTCFGRLSRNAIQGTVIGQQVCATLGGQVTQTVLSTKHVLTTAIASALKLIGNQTKFFVLSDHDQGYKLSPRFSKKDMKIIIPKSSMLSITQITNTIDLDKASISRITDISEIKIEYPAKVGDEDAVIQDDVRLEYQGRRMHASREMLKYIRNNHLSLDERNNYVVDMSDWDYNKDLFLCLEKQFSTVDFSKGIENILESKMVNKSKRDNQTPADFIKEFVDYVSTRITLPLSVLMTIAYSAMIVSRKNGDYALPKPWTEASIGMLDDTMAHRSLGVLMAFQGQAKVLTRAESFVNTNRLDHVFDYMLLPQEVEKYKTFPV